VEHRHAGAPGSEARQRRRRLPAGHPLGSRFIRLFPVLRHGRRHRGPAVREPAGASRGGSQITAG
jgi:hypothetical protein